MALGGTDNTCYVFLWYCWISFNHTYIWWG